MLVIKKWWFKGDNINPSALKNYDKFLAHVIMLELEMANRQTSNPDKYSANNKEYVSSEKESFGVILEACSDLVCM